MKHKYGSFEISVMAIFLALGLVLQYIEGLIVITSIPGGKIGLANIVSIINIFMFGGGNAMIIATLRAFIGAMLSSGVNAAVYSVAGAILSTLSMWIFKIKFYPHVSMIGIGVVGAAAHNVAQLFVASLMFSSAYVFSYLPFLLLFSVLSGMITGYAAQMFGNRFFNKYRRNI